MTTQQPEEWKKELEHILIDWSAGQAVPMRVFQVAARMQTLTPFIQELLTTQRTNIIEEIRDQLRKRKPTHGGCCTCQTCGYTDADGHDCECPRNKIIEDILNLPSLKPLKK